MATVAVFGTVRITDTPGVVYTRLFSNTVTMSVWDARTIKLLDTDEEIIVSDAKFSSPSTTLLFTDIGSITRANFTGQESANSHASLGFEFAGFFMQMGSGISGALGVNMANSSGDSATVTLLRAQ